jgi:hypothetical protein
MKRGYRVALAVLVWLVVIVILAFAFDPLFRAAQGQWVIERLCLPGVMGAIIGLAGHFLLQLARKPHGSN